MVLAQQLSTTVRCPLCGIPPPCSHRADAAWLNKVRKNRVKNHTLSKADPESEINGTAAPAQQVVKKQRQKSVREPYIVPWVVQIKHAYENKPSTWALRQRREARRLKRNGPVREHCNRKLNRDPKVRWIPPEYRDHPMLQVGQPVALYIQCHSVD